MSKSTAAIVISIMPHVGAGALKFGMSRSDVEQALGVPQRRFRRSELALEEDQFAILGCTVHYDATGRCTAITYSCDHSVDLEYEGYRLFSHSATAVRSWALARDPGMSVKDGFISILLGLAMWADWIDADGLSAAELNSPASSFMIFEPAYHERERARLELAREQRQQCGSGD